MKKVFKVLGIAVGVCGVMMGGAIADRHSGRFSKAVDETEKGLKSAWGWMKGIVQPKQNQ